MNTNLLSDFRNKFTLEELNLFIKELKKNRYIYFMCMESLL